MRMSKPADLPDLKKAPKAPTGPRFIPAHELVVGGYGDPPPTFLTGQNSLTEWIAYWALAKIFNDPKDPRQPPFFGGVDWGYQIARLGGFVRAIGSAVVDFVVYQGATILGIRIQTERFHTYAGSKRHGYDLIQRATLEGSGLTVIDVYDTDLLGDPSGQKAIIAMKKAIGRIERVSPINAGTGYRASRLKVLG